MTVLDYLGSKATAYLLMASGIYLIPQFAFHLGQAGLSDDGFLSYLGSNLDILWKVLAVTAGFVLIHGGVLALISSYIDRTPFAAATFLGVLVAGGSLAATISEASFPGARWAALLAFDGHARTIRDWVFDVDLSTNAPEAAGFSPWVSVATVAVVGVVGAGWTYRRYRRLA